MHPLSLFMLMQLPSMFEGDALRLIHHSTDSADALADALLLQVTGHLVVVSRCCCSLFSYNFFYLFTPNFLFLT